MSSIINNNSNITSTPLFLLGTAILYRGRRIELRQDYERAEDPMYKCFLEYALKVHTEIMILENRPIRSFLWRAEKNGHSLFLFGDIHNTIQKTDEFSSLESEKDKISYLKSFFHPKVLNVFENSQRMYSRISPKFDI